MADDLVSSLDWFDRAVEDFARTLEEIGTSFDEFIDEINEWIGFPAVPIKILPIIHGLFGKFPKAKVPGMAALVEAYFGRAELVVEQLEALAARSELLAELYRGTGSPDEFAQAVNRAAQQHYSLSLWLANYGMASSQMLTTVISAIVQYQGNLITMMMEFFWFLSSLVYSLLSTLPLGPTIILTATRRAAQIGDDALRKIAEIGFRKAAGEALESGARRTGEAIARRAESALGRTTAGTARLRAGTANFVRNPLRFTGAATRNAARHNFGLTSMGARVANQQSLREFRRYARQEGIQLSRGVVRELEQQFARGFGRAARTAPSRLSPALERQLARWVDETIERGGMTARNVLGNRFKSYAKTSIKIGATLSILGDVKTSIQVHAGLNNGQSGLGWDLKSVGKVVDSVSAKNLVVSTAGVLMTVGPLSMATTAHGLAVAGIIGGRVGELGSQVMLAMAGDDVDITLPYRSGNGQAEGFTTEALISDVANALWEHEKGPGGTGSRAEFMDHARQTNADVRQQMRLANLPDLGQFINTTSPVTAGLAGAAQAAQANLAASMAGGNAAGTTTAGTTHGGSTNAGNTNAGNTNAGNTNAGNTNASNANAGSANNANTQANNGSGSNGSASNGNANNGNTHAGNGQAGNTRDENGQADSGNTTTTTAGRTTTNPDAAPSTSNTAPTIANATPSTSDSANGTPLTRHGRGDEAGNIGDTRRSEPQQVTAGDGARSSGAGDRRRAPRRVHHDAQR